MCILLIIVRILVCSVSLPVIRCSTPKSILLWWEYNVVGSVFLSRLMVDVVVVVLPVVIVAKSSFPLEANCSMARRVASAFSVQMYV